MKLNHLDDQSLLVETRVWAQRERTALAHLLYHLREVERRRLYSALKYQSLLEYVMKDLIYSEPDAIRRISAMRLLRDVPQIEEKVASGELSLTNMVLAQTMFSKERKAGREFSAEQKAEVLERLENRTTREAQAIVCEISPEMKKKDNLDFDSIADEALRAKLLRLKGLLAHSDPYISLPDLLHKICDEAIERRLPSAPKVKRANPSGQAEIRRQVWRRDQHKCTNCGSTHALQIDHILPQAKGGPSTLENMRLLCRSCNQRAAINEFGENKMKSYLREPCVKYGLQ